MLVSRVWFTNNHRREQKETINQLTISYLPITFGVSEKRLLGSGWVPTKMASSGMLQVNPFVSSIG
ncbi:hypothetical protein T03_11007 [Trichinella britovi]|uniref:Uncharacterized protein n=1 Tax=Trichinella britovi TaxID=45882 RepID=A0A0V1C5K7_TRIBR|nr:hypothetical protein T03_11007 [Trichinella britovi]